LGAEVSAPFVRASILIFVGLDFDVGLSDQIVVFAENSAARRANNAAIIAPWRSRGRLEGRSAD
jgi:hypothetical protein